MTNRQRLLHLITGNPSLIDRLLVVADGDEPTPVITSPDQAHRIFLPLIAGQPQEHFAVAALNRRRRLIHAEVLTIGTDGFTIVDPRQVYSWALRQGRTGAHAIIVAHNHPSGDSTPSSQDRDVTHRLVRAGQVLGIQLLDHLVIGARGYTSLADHGAIPQVWDGLPATLH